MMTENELKTYTQLMKTRFMEDPGVIFQINGLDRADLLIEAQFEGQIQAFMAENAVQVLADGQGLLIGYATREWPEERLTGVMQQSAQKLLAVVNQDELQVLSDRANRQAQIIPSNWHLAYGATDVYHLLVIATDRSARGTGAFRKLLTPVLKKCAAAQEPIVLETFNPDNLPIYEHFGFQLMESHHSEEIGLTCYCMMRSSAN
ncbi:GNAT family N-acetyltransferase [Acetobacterium wieringae]|uniref:GNAT family N-acetyltransferase n=1 Tax=Acetobacterium wieringae TaxID=52694 RepID=UPI0026EF9895|nr:GNAT family N-acetyltransferase [Acetobacterium wieringae]